VDPALHHLLCDGQQPTRSSPCRWLQARRTRSRWTLECRKKPNRPRRRFISMASRLRRYAQAVPCLSPHCRLAIRTRLSWNCVAGLGAAEDDARLGRQPHAWRGSLLGEHARKGRRRQNLRCQHGRVDPRIPSAQPGIALVEYASFLQFPDTFCSTSNKRGTNGSGAILFGTIVAYDELAGK